MIDTGTATVTSAALVLVAAVATVWQRFRADERDAWWKRVQWAIDQSLKAEPETRVVGFAAMEALSVVEAARQDNMLLRKIMYPEADIDFYESDDEPHLEGGGSHGST